MMLIHVVEVVAELVFVVIANRIFPVVVIVRGVGPIGTVRGIVECGQDKALGRGEGIQWLDVEPCRGGSRDNAHERIVLDPCEGLMLGCRNNAVFCIVQQGLCGRGQGGQVEIGVVAGGQKDRTVVLVVVIVTATAVRRRCRAGVPLEPSNLSHGNERHENGHQDQEQPQTHQDDSSRTKSAVSGGGGSAVASSEPTSRTLLLLFGFGG